MKPVWKWFAWILVLCGILAYFVGWIGVLARTTFWGIPNEILFYDAIATGIFGLFFLAWGMLSEKK